MISAYIAVYLGIASESARLRVEARTLIQSFDLFTALIGEGDPHDVDLTACWSVLREYQAGISRRPLCGQCGTYYIISDHSDVPPTCPFCALRKRQVQSVRLAH